MSIPDRRHLCLHPGCKAEIERHHLMCLPHWKRVPLMQQREIHRLKKLGETDGTHPSRSYLSAVRVALRMVSPLQPGEERGSGKGVPSPRSLAGASQG